MEQVTNIVIKRWEGRAVLLVLVLVLVQVPGQELAQVPGQGLAQAGEVGKSTPA